MRAAFAWSLVPVILGTFLGSLSLLFTLPRWWYLVDLLLNVWGLVLLVKCLGEVHHFSLWRALVTTTLTGLVLSIPGLCLVAIDIVLKYLA